jgi:hypothetical protein
MQTSCILCHVALVRTNVSEELSASIIGVTRIGELGKLAVTSNRSTLRKNRSVLRLLVMTYVSSSQILVTLMIEALNSSESSVLTRSTRRNSPKDAIFLHEVISQKTVIFNLYKYLSTQGCIYFVTARVGFNFLK